MEAILDVRHKEPTFQNGIVSAYRQSATEKKSEETSVEPESTQNPISKDDVQKLVNDLNKEVEQLETNIRFGFNDKLNGMTVSVYDKETNKILRKFPTDEAVELMVKMREINGIIFDRIA